jgi:hypothetical protein
MFLYLSGAPLYIPARFEIVLHTSADEKKDLPFDISRNRSPPLFVTVNSLDGTSQKFRHLLLCFLESFPHGSKFSAFHRSLHLLQTLSAKQTI